MLVMGADGFGKPISRMAHRPELYARLAGATEDQEVTPELAARVVRLECLHDPGIPESGGSGRGVATGPAAGGGAGLSRDGGDPAGGPVASG